MYFFFIDKVYAFLQLGTCLTIPLLSRYNGRRGTWKGMGKVFYAYYPVHLVLCGVLRDLGDRRFHRHRELLTAGGGYCFSSPSRRL